MSVKVFIGTSGYNYKHWKDIFYPNELKQHKWLEYYCEHFPTVELNVTFYRLPTKATFSAWYRRTKSDFVFALKGSRTITHIKRLKDIHESLSEFFSAVGYLKEKLWVILWQLPPSLKLDSILLKDFCQMLRDIIGPRQIRQVFEFRHVSWFTDEVYKILSENNYCVCMADSSRWPSVDVSTADFVYLRLHGCESLYSSNYSESQLKNWSEWIKKYLHKNKTVFVYFNNDFCGFAVNNAKQLMLLCQ